MNFPASGIAETVALFGVQKAYLTFVGKVKKFVSQTEVRIWLFYGEHLQKSSQ